MQSKSPSKSWNEIEMLISAIAIALTLGLWNLFASSRKPEIASADARASLPPPPDTTAFPASTAVSVPMLLPGQVLLLGGTLPQPLPSPSAAASVSAGSSATTVRPSGGGSKPPVTKTHSSHP